MAFPLFFLLASALLLVSALFVIRSRDANLKSFSIASSLTTLLLLAGAVFRLVDRVDQVPSTPLHVDALTVANFSAATVLLAAWAVKLRSWPD